MRKRYVSPFCISLLSPLSLSRLQMHAGGADVSILAVLIYSLLVNCNLPYLEGHLVHRDIVLETGRQFI